MITGEPNLHNTRVAHTYRHLHFILIAVIDRLSFTSPQPAGMKREPISHPVEQSATETEGCGSGTLNKNKVLCRGCVRANALAIGAEAAILALTSWELLYCRNSSVRPRFSEYFNVRNSRWIMWLDYDYHYTLQFFFAEWYLWNGFFGINIYVIKMINIRLIGSISNWLFYLYMRNASISLPQNCSIIDFISWKKEQDGNSFIAQYAIFVHYGNWLDVADDSVGSHIAYRNREVASLGRRTTTFERPRSTAVVAAEFMYFLDNNFVGCAFPSSITDHKLQWVHGRQ